MCDDMDAIEEQPEEKTPRGDRKKDEGKIEAIEKNAEQIPNRK